MDQKQKTVNYPLIFANIALLFFAGALVAYSFSAPPKAPPQGSTPGALNSGKFTQVKAGGLSLGFFQPGVGLSVLGGSNTGFVGIGVLNPREKLDLFGDFFVNGLILPGGSGGFADQVLALDASGNLMTWDDKYQWLSLMGGQGKPLNCGNSFCDSGLGETCSTCAIDCGCSPGNICIGGSCVLPPAGSGGQCGNGACELSEGCDTCPQDCNACSSPNCGNGIWEPSFGEACDGINQGACAPGAEMCSGCSCINILPPEYCGNGIVAPWEECDPPNLGGAGCPMGTQYCDFSCKCGPSTYTCDQLSSSQCVTGSCPPGELCKPSGGGCGCTDDAGSVPRGQLPFDQNQAYERHMATQFPGVTTAEAALCGSSHPQQCPASLGWLEYNEVCAGLSDGSAMWVRNCYQKK